MPTFSFMICTYIECLKFSECISDKKNILECDLESFITYISGKVCIIKRNIFRNWKVLPNL